jgi:hypothetical protein
MIRLSPQLMRTTFLYRGNANKIYGGGVNSARALLVLYHPFEVQQVARCRDLITSRKSTGQSLLRCRGSIGHSYASSPESKSCV